MIKSFRHKGLELFFKTGSISGIQAKHIKKLRLQLTVLNRATKPDDMAALSWQLHPLKGADLKGHWAVSVNGNWRLTFKFDGTDVIVVDYQDYH
ncbi:MAG: type II toxin-antitoxin system RelE/ParE family toxin [Enterobacteriaceae bacterium]|jgi:proteic killer suppression protein|nr:type II toxin-antitoxin system RelE/ParE family toxin [Enterobacteriaceae bacterium]